MKEKIRIIIIVILISVSAVAYGQTNQVAVSIESNTVTIESNAVSTENNSATIESNQNIAPLNIKPENEDIEEEDSKPLPSKVESAQQNNRKLNIFLNFELGGGDMINAYGIARLAKIPKLYFGLGGSFTYSKAEYFEEEYSQYFYTFAGVVGYKIYNIADLTFDIRERIGNEFMSIGDYKASGLLLSTDLLIGYDSFYGIVAIPFFIGKNENVINILLGLGYQLKVY